ncbi:MAG: GAF domain-containing protein [Hoeflea sp.]|uniref:GAF domain-containing protein n=1 Tax=Hoeflea sp. TaxID=1940281 RepID=UPI001D5BFA48|nr:GAF domain-containing protein [Hoeflea sp.]MBU4529621.1 GAF domain-containing protein [Alphaproteobacteria bacterium]MBU4546740.1 GAF domain-containing protein [Alphaproteobacteria bacterium]MBU4551008.1 GAF domain-containing protein [Alphaproteobacteria bacterium]MBV1723950.1 GAF domain-containing protein [Hoeflea sp.]MBV1763227.1 GAF domain-containing protein [Hoeflea sp.]
MKPIHDHIDKVLAASHSASGSAKSRLVASWRRSITVHGLDPGQDTLIDRIDEAALLRRRQEMERFLLVAAPKLDQLFGLVGQSGCAVMLCDSEGVVLDQRCNDADRGAFQSWGLWEGANWSEAAVGTNGIGTCLAENRRVIIHQDEHFLARNTAMSCMDAPIYGPEGELVGALDVSSARSDQTEAFNRLIAAMIAQTARQIEADTFRAAFPNARILHADADDTEAATLLAVDGDDIVVGATRGARKAFGMSATGQITPVPASDLFGRKDGLRGFEKAERAALIRALTRTGGNVSKAARDLGVGRATLYRRMKRLGIGENAEVLSHL